MPSLFWGINRDGTGARRRGRRLIITDKQKAGITDSIMLIDTKKQCFDMQEIQNRRFMYNPRSGTMILGYQYKRQNKIISSHAEEHARCGTREPYDDFIRGWIGTGRQYKEGVIHFAPNIGKDSPAELFNRAYDTFTMFRENGAKDGTVIRAFGAVWEQPLSSIIPAPSVLRRLEQAKAEAVCRAEAGRREPPAKQGKKEPER